MKKWGKLKMGKLNENTIIFNKNLFVGTPSDIDSVVDGLKRELNCIIGSEVRHKNKPFIVKDINFTKDVVDYHIEAIILLEKMEDTDLIYTLLEARNKVLEELANE